MSVSEKISIEVSEQSVAARLEGLAKESPPVTYSDFLEYFGLPRVVNRRTWSDSAVSKYFPEIDAADKRANRPLRTSMVVRKKGEKKTFPGNGYYKSLCEYREISLPITAPEKREVHKAELDRLFDYYRVDAVEPD